MSDPTMFARQASIGVALKRIDGPLKVTGTAQYAYEHPVKNPVYLYPIFARIARGKVKRIDASAAKKQLGVLLVMTHENAPKLWIKVDADL